MSKERSANVGNSNSTTEYNNKREAPSHIQNQYIKGKEKRITVNQQYRISFESEVKTKTKKGPL